jgi:soluble lytic murein transglycosylase
LLLLVACTLPARETTGGDTQQNSTATRAPTNTPTNTATPTPTATPQPADRISNGDRLLFYGDYDSAEVEYQLVLNSESQPEILSAAQLGISRAHYGRGDNPTALNNLRLLIDTYPESPSLPQAYYFLAMVFKELERYQESADAFRMAIALQPGGIQSYLQEQLGNVLSASGDYAAALAAYQEAVNTPRAGSRYDLLRKLALAYRQNDMPETGLLVYQDLQSRAENDFQRAQLLLLSGQTYLEMQQPEAAFASYLEAVENYPQAYDSYTALVELVNNGLPVSELDRGLVDYFAGQYALAQAAFDRYMVAPEDEDGASTALYYRGLTKRALGDETGAIADWDLLITGYPFTLHWDRAWEQKGYTQWAWLELYPQAVQTFRDFVEQFPDHPRAVEFLDFAARVAERGGELETAAGLWDQINVDYPNSNLVYRASFLAGITYYRLQRFDEGRTSFERAQTLSATPAERAAALLWVGKSYQANGASLEAGTAWQQAALADPTGYYAERAEELLAGHPPFRAPVAYDFSFNAVAERAEAEAWLRTAFTLPEDTSFDISGPFAQEQHLLRGTALWELGLYELARAEFEELRSALVQNPAATYRLGHYLIELGLYRPGIVAIRSVLDMAGLDDATTLNAPTYFNRLRFGPYFGDLIIPAAQENGFHPLFVFSVARQESLFEGFVRSSAGARGVMQIIPSTGESIAARLGFPPNYTAEDLYRPFVNITLGSAYLGQQRDLFDGNLYAALAAYNGGPGNAQVWQQLAGDDPDLLLEIIRFDETQRYIRSIFEIYQIYHWLYDRSP